jgi:hypothetical protein
VVRGPGEPDHGHGITAMGSQLRQLNDEPIAAGLDPGRQFGAELAVIRVLVHMVSTLLIGPEAFGRRLVPTETMRTTLPERVDATRSTSL